MTPRKGGAPSTVAATFEFAGNAIGLIALAVAVILAAPFMVGGWAAYRVGAWR